MTNGFCEGVHGNEVYSFEALDKNMGAHDDVPITIAVAKNQDEKFWRTFHFSFCHDKYELEK
jgi:hypothetical protein